MWSYRTGGSIYSSPAVANGRVYVGSFDKRLYCLKAADDEEEQWPMFRYNLTRTGSRAQASCIASSVLGAENEKIAALRAFRDEVLARTPAGKAVIAAYYSGSERLVPLCEQYPVIAAAAKNILSAAVPVLKVVTTKN
jgi:outer membrane protein assembly factor BamB